MKDIKNITIEYVCSYCGRIEAKGKKYGRPSPGVCPRKVNGGSHTWKINRVIDRN